MPNFPKDDDDFLFSEQDGKQADENDSVFDKLFDEDEQTPKPAEKTSGVAASNPLASITTPVDDDDLPTGLFKKPRPENTITARGILGWIGLGLVGMVAFTIILAIAFRFGGPFGTLNMAFRDMAHGDARWSTIRIEDLPPHVIQAVIAAEDSRFCQHSGFDFKAIDKALSEKKERGYLRGASTISQQTAKNVFLWNGGGWPRKGAEAWFTILIETFWSKKRIMEAYLNVAEFGPAQYGIERGAWYWFGKSAKDLSPHEAARLAAILPSPKKWSARPAGDYVTKRTAVIQANMREIAYVQADACVLGK